MAPPRHRLPWDPPGLPAKPWVREAMKKPKLLLGSPLAVRVRSLEAAVWEPSAEMALEPPVELGLAAQ